MLLPHAALPPPYPQVGTEGEEQAAEYLFRQVQRIAEQAVATRPDLTAEAARESVRALLARSLRCGCGLCRFVPARQCFWCSATQLVVPLPSVNFVGSEAASTLQPCLPAGVWRRDDARLQV